MVAGALGDGSPELFEPRRGVDLLVEGARNPLSLVLDQALNTAVEHHLDHLVSWPEEVWIRAQGETESLGTKIRGDLTLLVEEVAFDQFVPDELGASETELPLLAGFLIES